MSKIGKLPIELPEGVKVEIKGSEIVIMGPGGILTRQIPRGIEAEIKDGAIFLTTKKSSPSISAIYGTTRALMANMVKGVSSGWKKILELVGAGYKAELRGSDLILNIGYSHPVEFKAPPNITFKVEKNLVTIEGIDREVVGQTAAIIRAARPPEPYKGKGIKYQDEIIRRKAGKAAKTTGAA